MQLPNGKIRTLLTSELKQFQKKAAKKNSALVTALRNKEIEIYCDFNGSRLGQLSGCFGCRVTIPAVEALIDPYIDKNSFFGKTFTAHLYEYLYQEHYSNPAPENGIRARWNFERTVESVQHFFHEAEQITEAFILPDAMKLLNIQNLEKFFREITGSYENLNVFHKYKSGSLGNINPDICYEQRYLAVAYLAGIGDLDNVYAAIKKFAEERKASGMERLIQIPSQLEALYNLMKSGSVKKNLQH